jgi:hypothetical protein
MKTSLISGFYFRSDDWLKIKCKKIARKKWENIDRVFFVFVRQIKIKKVKINGK